VDVTHLLESVDDSDVRMVQRGEDFRFALESGDPFCVSRECFGQDLDGNLAIELRIARPIDLPHAAGAKGGQNLVRTEAGTGVEGQAVRRELYGSSDSADGMTLCNGAGPSGPPFLERHLATDQDSSLRSG
jgi:hypothetical protein